MYCYTTYHTRCNHGLPGIVSVPLGDSWPNSVEVFELWLSIRSRVALGRLRWEQSLHRC